MKDDVKAIEKQMKALANQRRLSIIKFLKRTPDSSVGDIAEEIKLSFKATSKHLGILYAAGIVEKEQDIITVNYRIAKSLHLTTKQVLSTL